MNKPEAFALLRLCIDISRAQGVINIETRDNLTQFINEMENSEAVKAMKDVVNYSRRVYDYRQGY